MATAAAGGWSGTPTPDNLRGSQRVIREAIDLCLRGLPRTKVEKTTQPLILIIDKLQVLFNPHDTRIRKSSFWEQCRSVRVSGYA
jgi:hypothetical protein